MEPVRLEGIIMKFKGDGRKFGYPTANIRVDTALRDGVYFGHASLLKHHDAPALIFVGIPETIEESERRVEIYILDIADEDYYDNIISASVEYFWRANMKFNSVEELITAMHDDEKNARLWFSSQGNLIHPNAKGSK